MGGDVYVVKGMQGPGPAALTSELLSAELGNRLGLPIPPYGIMRISQEMIDFTMIEGANELAGGPAFASKLVENVTTLIYQQVPQVDPDLQLRVLVFDKWIRNGDRQLTAKGGNANLLVCKEGNLVVIDHNMAFDMSEDDRNLLASHVFIGQAAGPDDLVTRADLRSSLDTALADWDRIADLVPEEWVYRDPLDTTSALTPTMDDRLQSLRRIENDEFWRLI